MNWLRCLWLLFGSSLTPPETVVANKMDVGSRTKHILSHAYSNPGNLDSPIQVESVATDGTSMGDPGPAGIVEVIDDSNGFLIWFMRSFGYATSCHVEIWVV